MAKGTGPLSSIASGVAIALLVSACNGGGVESTGAPADQLGAATEEAAVAPPEAAEAGAEPAANDGEGSQQATPASRRRQLIKTVSVDLRVDSVEETVDDLRAIAQKHQGDILSLNDSKIDDRPSARLELSIPQGNLEAALADAQTLGQVDQRNISAQDVTNQIVDTDARLRNLRRTEEQLLKIMDRAGSIKDVLSVTEQLSSVRQQIEQIDAQLKSLRERVAYSTLTITVQQKQAAIALDNPLGQQLGDTWTGATRSMGDLTVGLLKISLWLLAYTPYWLLLVGLGWGTHKMLKRQKRGQDA